MACEKWLWARVWGVWLRCAQQTGQCWAVSLPTVLCHLHLRVYTLCAVSQSVPSSAGLVWAQDCCLQLMALSPAGIMVLDLLKGAEPLPQPWAVKKVMWFNLPVGSMLNQSSIQVKAGDNLSL